MAEAKVAVLLCTFNGEQHLEEQLESIAQQGFAHIDVWVSDDGSTDGTLDLLERFRQRWDKGRFIIRQGPKKGFAANFLSLACDEQIEADYYAYSDQDDVWERDKLSRAVKVLSQYRSEQAALYCSRTTLISESGEFLGKNSPLFNKQPDFRNALVQSLAGGNTMVFNHQARNLLCQAGMLNVISHDWWTYMLVAGAGGSVEYDGVPSVRYRQHCDNEIGANTSWSARLSRVGLLLAGRYRQWNEVNITALNKARYLLTDENQYRLDLFLSLRHNSLINRLKLAKEAGLYRQTFFGNLALIGATILNKL